MPELACQRCIHPACAATVALDSIAFRCPRCGGLLDVVYDWDRLSPPKSLRDFEARWARRTDRLDLSGVWRFRDLLPFAKPEQIATSDEMIAYCQEKKSPVQASAKKPYSMDRNLLHISFESGRPELCRC